MSGLKKGSYFYVCGDATRMAKDVDQALCDLIAEHGDLTADKAGEYVNNLKREKRYLTRRILGLIYQSTNQFK